MKPVNVENLENILTRIWSGELRHNQTGYFYETSCCLAGWDVALNSDERPKKFEDNYGWYLSEKTEAYDDPFGWSMKHNNLTKGEAVLLFDSDATRSLHEAILTALKAGRRFKQEFTNFFFVESLDYSSEFGIETKKSDVHEKLVAFLGEEHADKINYIGD